MRAWPASGLFAAVVVLTLNLAAVGCAEPSGEAGNASGWENLPQLTVDTVAEIGGSTAAEPATLARVRDATILYGAPRLAIADGLSQDIRIFDLRDGRHIVSFGGVGQGPGEFTGLQRLAALADGGVAAWDQVQNRFTTLAPDGDLRSVASPASPSLPGREAAFVGAFPDGRYILQFRRSERRLRGNSGGLRVDTVPFLLYTPLGELVDTLAVAPSPARFHYDRGVVWGTEDLIFGRSLVSATGPDRLVLAWDDLSVLEAHGPGGQRSSISGFLLRPRSVSSARIEVERARRVDALANSTPRVRDASGVDLTEGIVQERRRIIEDLDAHSSTPAFDLLVVGGEGALWVRRFPFPEEESATWIELRPDGTPQGRLTLAKEERVLAAKAGWIVVLSQDRFGSPVVRVVDTL